MNIIDKVAEAEAAPLDIKIQRLQLLLVVAEQVATVGVKNKLVKMVQMGFVAYSGMLFQARQISVMQKKFSLNVGKDFENIQVYDVAYCILQLVM